MECSAVISFLQNEPYVGHIVGACPVPLTKMHYTSSGQRSILCTLDLVYVTNFLVFFSTHQFLIIFFSFNAKQLQVPTNACLTQCKLCRLQQLVFFHIILLKNSRT
jgi:hypothetical protein